MAEPLKLSKSLPVFDWFQVAALKAQGAAVKKGFRFKLGAKRSQQQFRSDCDFRDLDAISVPWFYKLIIRLPNNREVRGYVDIRDKEIRAWLKEAWK